MARATAGTSDFVGDGRIWDLRQCGTRNRTTGRGLVELAMRLEGLGIFDAPEAGMQDTEYPNDYSVLPTRLRPHGAGKKALLNLPERVLL